MNRGQVSLLRLALEPASNRADPASKVPHLDAKTVQRAKVITGRPVSTRPHEVAACPLHVTALKGRQGSFESWVTVVERMTAWWLLLRRSVVLGCPAVLDCPGDFARFGSQVGEFPLGVNAQEGFDPVLFVIALLQSFVMHEQRVVGAAGDEGGFNTLVPKTACELYGVRRPVRSPTS